MKGTVFGYRVRFHNVPEVGPVTVDIRYMHPPIIDKNGKESTGFTNKKGRIRAVNGKFEGGVLYSFSEDYELAPGKWKFDVIHQGKVIATKTFSVK